VEWLVRGHGQPPSADARAQLARAADALSELLAGPSRADIDAAHAAVLTATETLHNLQNPTDAAIASAISGDSTLLALEQLLADPTPLPAPEQPRSDITMREFRAIQNRSVDSAYANHPAG